MVLLLAHLAYLGLSGCVMLALMGLSRGLSRLSRRSSMRNLYTRVGRHPQPSLFQGAHWIRRCGTALAFRRG